MSYLKNFVYGILLGFANIAPTISGGTMAVLLNIYDKILFAISLKNVRKNLPFLLPLGAGCLFGIFLFSKIMATLLQSYESLMNFCFIGMIIGSTPMIYRRAKCEKITFPNVFLFLCALAAMLLFSKVSGGSPGQGTLEQMIPCTGSEWVWLFFVSVVSTIAMILPGLSGSYVMFLLGAYNLALEAIASFYLPVLLTIAAGVLVGGFLGVKLIKKMLRFYPQALYFVILGLVIGSIFTIYPGVTWDIQGALSISLLVFFALLSYFFCEK